MLHVKFVIASRTHANHILEEKLKMEPVRIEQLNQNDVKEYLQKENIIEIISEYIPSQFFENPLYLQFLISLVQEDSSNFREMDTFDLYKKFIHKKVERYHKKYKQDYNPGLEALMCKTLKRHRLLALIAIFREGALEKASIIKKYNTLSNELKENECKIGFIKYFDKHDFPVFSHETFAEFLAVEWIVENIEKKPALEIYKQTISDWNSDFRKFFDIMICKDLKLHMAIIKYDVLVAGKLCSEPDSLREVDRFGRNALHLVSNCWHRHSTVIKLSTVTFRFDYYDLLDTIIGYMRNYEIDTRSKDSIMKWSWIECKFNLKKSQEKTYEEILANELNNAVRLSLKNYVEYLLDVEKHSINNYASLPFLLTAAQNPTVDIVKSLIARGADITVTDSIGKTVLHYAAGNKQLNVIKYFLDLSLANIDQTDANGDTALHVACSSRNFNAVAALLDKGADPNIAGRKGRNALLHFISRLDIDTEDVFLIIDKLIDNNINLEQKDNSGNIVLHYVCKHERKDLLCYFLKKLDAKSLFNTNIRGKTPFHAACRKGCITLVEYIIEEHPNILSLADNFGNTCLHYAAICKNKSVLSILLDKMGYSGNTNVEIRNYSGETLLHNSVGYDSYDVTKFLLEIGHDPNLVDENGDTPLHWAALFNSSTIDILIQKGANIEARNKDLETPIRQAFQSDDNHESIEKLFENGADINAKDINGNTPLHMCAMNKECRPETLRTLIRFGANFKIKNNRNRMPFGKESPHNNPISRELSLYTSTETKICQNNNILTDLRKWCRCKRHRRRWKHLFAY